MIDKTDILREEEAGRRFTVASEPRVLDRVKTGQSDVTMSALEEAIDAVSIAAVEECVSGLSVDIGILNGDGHEPSISIWDDDSYCNLVIPLREHFARRIYLDECATTPEEADEIINLRFSRFMLKAIDAFKAEEETRSKG